MKKILILFMLIASIAGVTLYGRSRVTPMNSRQIIEKVRNLAEVKDYLVRVPNGKIDIDNETEAEYNIHVYEVLNNHTATFNWYIVDKKTGKISPM